MLGFLEGKDSHALPRVPLDDLHTLERLYREDQRDKRIARPQASIGPDGVSQAHCSEEMFGRILEPSG